MNYAIITENDESKWDDQTGVLYHFPARYKNILTTGTRVIYYKGKMNSSKYLSRRLSKEPHYFGIATIGEVYPDENKKNQYFAEIEDYIPFMDSVNFKQNNNYLEYVSKSNYWRDGVRKITEQIYINIVSLSNLEIQSSNQGQLTVQIKEESLPNIHDVDPQVANNLIRKRSIKKGNNTSNKRETIGTRFSSNAKKIGDRAEEVVLKYLENEKMSNIRWLANEGEKPGYDIFCINQCGEELYIEVKGTTTSKFDGFIITDNELQMSRKLGDRFYIYFVTNCLSKEPKIQSVQNPFKKIDSNDWGLKPLSYQVSIYE